jgi:hypothetical protein
MKQYKYNLDKSSKKFICPNCQQKRFVKYINVETGQYADSIYGRCDRQENCKYSCYPNNNQIIYKTSTHQLPKPTSYINQKVVRDSCKYYDKNPLVTYLFKKYDKEKVENVITEYQLGTSNKFNGSCVFWQQDNTGNFRSGKIMAYNVDNGSRAKNHDGTALISWAHKALNLNDFNLKQCLFGLHLLNNTNKPIGIVESEKTAVIMRILLEKYTWMATGSASAFKYEKLIPLKGRKILAFPDKGLFSDWKKVAKELNKKGFDIKVSDAVEKEEYDKGWDLIDALEYDSKYGEITITEKLALKFIGINPIVKRLIDDFDLTDLNGGDINL